MDSELRPTMLLSSLVQTRSMELVLAPIASQVSKNITVNVCYFGVLKSGSIQTDHNLLQVSQLMILTETRGSTPFPDLTSSACTVMEAVQSLASVAQKVTTETADEVKLYYCCSVPIRARESNGKINTVKSRLAIGL